MNSRTIPCSYIGSQAESCLRQPGCGTLLGVFRHGWYLDCNGQVLLLHNTEYGRVPFGVGVVGFEETFLYRKDLEGTTVCWNNSELVISGAEVRISLCAADEPPFRLFRADVLGWMAPLAENLLEQEGSGYLRDLLPCRRKLVQGTLCPECAGDLHLTRSREALESFFCALWGRGELGAALQKLIGFGTGLTPSLDDWLVGFLYVLLRQPEAPLTKILCRQVQNLAEKRTNRISAAYLKAAAGGLYFEMLQRAGEARCAKDLYSLMKIGGSSGCDMLVGMLFAVCCLDH